MSNQPNVWTEETIEQEIRQLLNGLDPAMTQHPQLQFRQSNVLDSFALLNFALSIEQTFDVELSAKDLECFSQMTFVQLKKLIALKTNVDDASSFLLTT